MECERVAIEPMEEILRELPRRGALVKDRSYRQVWRFEAQGRPYYLKFYPRRGKWRPNPALREFQRLQWLQKANIPSPRAVSALVGFTLAGVKGDAVIMEGIEPSQTLLDYLTERELRAEPVPNRTALARQVTALLLRLGRAGLGHDDLHLGNLLLAEHKVFLLDAYAVRKGGLRTADVAYLGSSARRFATNSELAAGWIVLGGGSPLPGTSRRVARYWRKFPANSLKENNWFGRLNCGPWRGHFFKRAKSPRRWSLSSQMAFSAADWQAAWPDLLHAVESGRLDFLKQSPSGDTMAAEISIGGRMLAVVAKRPYKKLWYRYVLDVFRGSRARRAWLKSWRLIARDVPCAWPLLVMEKRLLGYVTDSLLVMERVAGPALAEVRLDDIPPRRREMLFHRTGAVLRRIDATGLAHFDAKSSNWIVQDDPVLGPRAILVDADGIRARHWPALGIERLLRSMREHPQYTQADSLALCRGYAPWSRMTEMRRTEKGK